MPGRKPERPPRLPGYGPWPVRIAQIQRRSKRGYSVLRRVSVLRRFMSRKRLINIEEGGAAKGAKPSGWVPDDPIFLLQAPDNSSQPKLPDLEHDSRAVHRRGRRGRRGVPQVGSVGLDETGSAPAPTCGGSPAALRAIATLAVVYPPASTGPPMARARVARGPLGRRRAPTHASTGSRPRWLAAATSRPRPARNVSQVSKGKRDGSWEAPDSPGDGTIRRRRCVSRASRTATQRRVRWRRTTSRASAPSTPPTAARRQRVVRRMPASPSPAAPRPCVASPTGRRVIAPGHV